MAPEECALVLHADTAPFRGYLRLLAGGTELFERPLDFENLGFELVRVEHDRGTAPARELTVRLYPSDALLRHVAALLAGNLDFDVVEESFHGVPLVGSRLVELPSIPAGGGPPFQHGCTRSPS